MKPICGVLLALALLAGCVGRGPWPQPETLGQIGPNQVLLVGRVELSPALGPDEQHLAGWEGVDEYKNRVFLLVDNQFRKFSTLITYRSSWDTTNGGEILAQFGKTFYAAAPANNPVFWNHTSFIVVRDVGGQGRGQLDQILLPSRFRIDLQPSDKAVYIGTIRFTRNAYFDVSKVEVVDDYRKESVEFHKIFGNSVDLVRRHLVKLDDKGEPIAGQVQPTAKKTNASG